MSSPIVVLVTRPVIAATATLNAGRDLRPADPGYLSCDPALASVSVRDPGVLRGDGIFETIGVINASPRALDAHLERFASSARMLDLPTPDLVVWRQAVLHAIEMHGPTRELSVRMTMTRGVGSGIGVEPNPASDTRSPLTSAWVSAEEVRDFEDVRRDGLRAVTLDRGYRSDVAVTSPWLLTGAKTLSYVVNAAALREAKRRDADDAIFTSSDGFVLEGTTSSVIVQHGTLVRTPGSDLGILAGTTQARAFDFFDRNGFDLGYGLIEAADLTTADGIWLLSSSRLAVPVRRLNGVAIAVDKILAARLNDHLLGEENA
ncbi:aminotransferase class IV [Homoserinimonas sp. OAct 916]|uniref:aminotransferase class IV n=1 Tax=Homoserinimonas sp. OAct 916 TaxID=2211450 RepID=UPI00130060DD|nr:aminotransferase class IV [Homoserinimonas sp. OAct 916]